MEKFYSKTTGGFYDSEINVNMPADVVSVTDTVYNDLLAAQESGNRIKPDANGNPVSVPPPPPTPAQQAAAIISGGLHVTSTGTSSLNGTYATDGNTTAEINAEITSLLLNGTFTDGTQTIQWPDIAGAPHAFNVAQFKTLATAIGVFVTGGNQYARGLIGSLPATSATIA